MQPWLLVAVLAVLGAVIVALTIALTRQRRRADREIARAAAQTAALRERLDSVERRLTPSAAAPREEFVITELGREPAPESTVPAVPARIDGRLFADLVLRESVVKGAALVHGIRRALTPENRFRMRYEFRREVKRSRKRRRLELREARRALSRRKSAGEDAA